MHFFQEFFPALQIKEAVYTRVEVSSPWGLDFMPYRHTKFGIVLAGECFIDLKDGQSPIRMEYGTCYLLPRGDAFRLRDKLLSDAVDFEVALHSLKGRLLRYGGDGEKTTIVGGRFIFADHSYPGILDLLPPLIHFKVSENELAALEATIMLLAKETTEPTLGSNIMVDRLADIFFIQSLRAYVLAEAQREVGWVGAVGDEKLTSAIRLMHNEIEYDWTIAALASRVGMSRAVFAARFKAKIGTSPMSYLTRFRLIKARKLLKQSSMSIAQIAAKVGYTSEAAFNKAFRRELGMPPGTFRALK